MWIGMATPWFPDTLVFLIHIFNPNISGAWYISADLYLLIGTAFIPVFVIFWMGAIRILLYEKKGILLILIACVISVIYEAIYFYFFFTDQSQLGIFSEVVFIVEFGLVIVFGVIYALILLLTTGFHFALYSLKSENPEHKLRGQFLIIAFISYAIGGVLDSIVGYSLEIVVVITRIIVISASIEFYIAFILPKWSKKLFLR